MKIVLIGSGNVASHIGPAFQKAGHEIIQVYSKHPSHARALSEVLHCPSTADTKNISSEADIYIVSLTDKATLDFSKKFRAGNKLIVHTSGSLPSTIFKGKKNKNYGVIYFLQSFSKAIPIDISQVPVCIEGNNPFTEKKLLGFAKSISKKIVKIDSRQRLALHVAAVFANNFTNHLLGISEEILEKNKLDFGLLRSLLDETFRKAMKGTIHGSQTGPAIRGDQAVIAKHLEFLSSSPANQKIYRLLSKSIASKKNK